MSRCNHPKYYLMDWGDTQWCSNCGAVRREAPLGSDNFGEWRLPDPQKPVAIIKAKEWEALSDKGKAAMVEMLQHFNRLTREQIKTLREVLTCHEH